MEWIDGRWIDGDELREEVRADFEEIGLDVGMEARCITGWEETSVTFETEEGYQHHFTFEPTLDGDEKPSYAH